MALRPWSGPVCFENVETGDGRVMAPGSLTHAPLPLPLAFLRDGDQHVDLTEVAPQIGTIETLDLDASGALQGTGFIDDANPDGAEALRRMDEGTAPLGARFPVSIDGDDWAVTLIVRDPEIVDMLDGPLDGDYRATQVQASGSSTIHLRAGQSLVRDMLRAPTGVAAAAGDPDPGADGGDEGVVLYEDAASYWLERFSQLRVRGATLCAVAAFDGAHIELGEAVAASAGISSPALPVDPYPPLPIPAVPDRDAFFMAEPQAGDDRLVEQPDGTWAVPFTITDDYRWFGHIAARSNHRGYTSPTVAPTSCNGYADFHTGEVVCSDGSRVPVGPLCVGGDHAPLSMEMDGARDFYANSTLGFADGRVVDGAYGAWGCGTLRPGLNEADLRILRALAPSGDWRASQANNLELICGLMVNVPGFLVAREAVAASALVASCGPGGCGTIGQAHDMVGLGIGDAGTVISMVAAGVVTRCPECAERARTAAMRDGFETDVRSFMRLMEARTRHLTQAAFDGLAASIRPAQ